MFSNSKNSCWLRTVVSSIASAITGWINAKALTRLWPFCFGALSMWSCYALGSPRWLLYSARIFNPFQRGTFSKNAFRSNFSPAGAFCTSSCKSSDKGKVGVSKSKTGAPTSASSSFSGVCRCSADLKVLKPKSHLRWSLSKIQH